MSKQLTQIDSLKKEIDHLSDKHNLTSDFLSSIKTELTYHSNKLENNKLSYGQTIKYLKELVQPKNASQKDCLDMKNHYDILDGVFKSYNNPLSEIILLELHAKLMQNIIQWDGESIYSPGKYKAEENYTVQSSGKLIKYLDPDLVPDAITTLFSKVNAEINTNDSHALNIATYFHIRFLEIHPFEDGNGPIARLLMNQLLLKAGDTPIFITETNRKEYLKLFEMCTSESYEPMVDFMANQLIESLKLKKRFFLNQQQS